MLSAADQRFRLGVNYWPAGAALGWWKQFDRGVVKADFDRIAAAGLDSVRFFLTWEAFQPTPDRVDATMLDQLIEVADVAAAANLQIMPTLFTGHMSGANLLPGWAISDAPGTPRFRILSNGRVRPGQARNWYGDNTVTEAQVLLAGTCASTLAGHRALWAWDLGNENSNCSIPQDRSLAREWLARVSNAIRQADPHVALTIGLHMEDLETDRQLGPTEAAAACDFLTMHGYPIYAPWANGPTDDALLGFLTEITRWLGGGAPVLFSEFGLPTLPPRPNSDAAANAVAAMLVEEQTAAAYTDRALRQLRTAGATGAMVWCANDYHQVVWNDPPFDIAHHERHFGMWRPDGSAKPALASITSYQGLDIIEASTERPWIDIDRSHFFTRDGSQLPRLYQRYRQSLA